MEGIFSRCLGTVSLDSGASFTVILPTEKKIVDELLTFMNQHIDSHDLGTHDAQYRHTFEKVQHRGFQLNQRKKYFAVCREIQDKIQSNGIDPEWDSYNCQLIVNINELKELKKQVSGQIQEMKTMKSKLDKVFSDWREAVKWEGSPEHSFREGLIHNKITEPLLLAKNLKEVVQEHISEKKPSIIDKISLALLKKMDAETWSAEKACEVHLATLNGMLEEVKSILKPEKDVHTTETMSAYIKNIIMYAESLDSRITKLTFNPESLISSNSSDTHVDDQPDGYHVEDRSEKSQNNSKKILTQNKLIQEAMKVPPEVGSGDYDMILELIPLFQRNLLDFIQEFPENTEKIAEFRQTLNASKGMFPKSDIGGALKLKIRDINLPQFSGKESEYFGFKSDVLDLLVNSRHDANSQTRSLKSDCFRNCPHVLDLVRMCKSVSEIFEILDARFGNVERHASRLILSIEKCPPAQESSRSIIELADCILRINNDISGAGALETVASFQTISKIKSKFSPLMSRDFVKQFGTLGEQDHIQQWKNVIDFLVQERQTQLSVSAFESNVSVNKPNLQAKVNIVSAISNASSSMTCVLCGANHLPYDKACSMTGDHLTPKTREKIKKIGLCMTCLNPACKSKHCNHVEYACQKYCKENGQPLHKRICDCVASKNLHNVLNPEISVKQCVIDKKNVSTYQIGPTVMLHEQAVLIDEISGHPVRVSVTYDMGATDSLCNESIGNLGKQKSLGKLKIAGFSNNCDVLMQNAKQISFTVKTQSGLQNIDSIQVSNLNIVSKCKVTVPKKWSSYFPQGFTGIGGKTDILLGGNCSHLFPVEIDRYTSNNECLILFRSEISGRYLLFGRNTNLVTFSNCSDPSVNKISVSTPGCMNFKPFDFDVDKDFDRLSSTNPDKCVENGCDGLINDFDMDITSDQEHQAQVQMTTLARLQHQFMAQLTAENADTEKFEDHSIKQKMEEEAMMNEGITFDHKLQCWNVRYFYNDKLCKLHDNYQHVLQRMKKLDQKLKMKPELCQQVNAEIQKNIQNGFWKKCSDLNFPAGCQKHYLPFNYTHNPSSTSTPCRIVCDSSAKDSSGLSLNQCQKSGRSYIGNLRGCLLKARTAQQLAIGDLSKFYNSFKLGHNDASLRRILVPMNGFGTDSEFQEYPQTCIPFGDKAAGILACMARDKNVNQFSAKVGDLAEHVKMIFQSMTYVDDVSATQSWNGDMDSVIDALETVATAGGLTFKKWTKMGDSDETKYLGYTWCPDSDVLKPRIWFNVGKYDRGAATEHNLTAENVETRVMTSFTKRDVLSVQGQFFDPLLILSPLIVKLRLLFGAVCEEIGPENWNTQLTLARKKQFIGIFKEIIIAENFSFQRSCISREYKSLDKPEVDIVCFTDGSLEAYACAIYLRLTDSNGKVHCNILTSGLKTVGVRKLTAPKTELLGAVLGVQVTNGALKEIQDLVKVRKVLYLTDSRIVLGQLQHNSGKFDVYIGSRIDFIQTNTKQATWMWVPGDQNPADLPTRGNSSLQEVNSTKWMNGGFLLEDECNWPVKEIAAFSDQLPGMNNSLIQAHMLVRQALVIQENYQEPWKQLMDKYSNLSKVVSIMGHCLKFKYPLLPISERRILALSKLMQDSMPLSKEMLKTSRGYDVQFIEEENSVYAKGRTLQSLNSNKLLVLSPKSSLARLIFRDYHSRFGHLSSVKKVQNKILENFYIPRSGKQLRLIKKSCNLCRKLMSIPYIQRMGDLRSERFQKSKPFTNILVDLLGPFNAFDSVKKRVSTKVWGMVISCCYTRAVWVTALENYSADAVISGLNRLKARFGQFQTVYTDLGTNLIAAGRLDNNVQNLDDIQLEGVKDLEAQFPDTTWKQGVPKAPWFMGGVECFVKQVKIQLKILCVKEGLHKLTHMEWETLFARISAVINERPLATTPEPGGTICANNLLYGHNNNVPHQSGLQQSSLTKRSSAVQENLQMWWNIYHSNFEKIASSITKWKTAEENIQVNDIVLLLDSPNKVGSYKTGKVVQVFPDNNGLVRKVKVEYKTSNQNRLTQVIRQCRTLSKLTHHNVDTDVVDNDDSSDSDIDHDDIDEIDGTPGNNDLATPLSTQQPQLKVQFAPEGKESILDLKKPGKMRRS